MIRNMKNENALANCAVLLTEYPRTLSELYLGLARASYRVELLLEPARGDRQHRRWWCW